VSNPVRLSKLCQLHDNLLSQRIQIVRGSDRINIESINKTGVVAGVSKMTQPYRDIKTAGNEIVILR